MAAEEINVIFGKHLRNIRTQLGLNQDDVAAACGIDPTSISRLERGETNATLTTLLRLSKGLSLSMRELMDMNPCYQVHSVDDELLGELRAQLRQLSLAEQQFVLDFIRNFVSLKNSSESKSPEL